jgi:transposase-like protein
MMENETKGWMPRFSGKQYIVLIDALWFRFQVQRYTLYLRAFKRVGGHTARFLPPIMLKGRESAAGWSTAIDEIPDRLKHRIIAMVSDGWRGVERAAHRNHWVLQRCHFHFIAQLQVNRGKRKKMRDQAIREEIYQMARILLTTTKHVCHYKNHVQHLVQRSDCPRRLRLIAGEFLRRLSDFRAYLNHPDMTLPTTTNAMESKNRQIRQLCRPLRTPHSLFAWVSHFLKFNPEITCNGGKIPQN